MQKRKDWFKDRGYPHFTNKTALRIKKKVEKYITNSKKIEKHSFSPLIFKQLKQRRYKLSDFNGKIRRSHKKLKNGKIYSNTKIREILYATHIDSHIYSYYSQNIISPNYELLLKSDYFLDNSITAYRQIKTKDGLKNKNNIHFAKDAFEEVKRRQNCVVLAFDIENFFPSLNHKLLKRIWARVLGLKSLPKDHYNVFKACTKFSYVFLRDLKRNINGFDEKELSKFRKLGKNTFFDNIKSLIESDITIHKNQKKNTGGKLVGIPQGLPISALLANMYMLPFDEIIVNELVKKYDIFYRRYSDDIILICNQNQVDFVEKKILEEITKIELKISKEKTEKTLFKIHNGRLQSFRILDNNLKINIPLNYLGFEFYGYQTLIKSKNLSNFYREMKMSIKRKHKRNETIKQKYLLDNSPIFKGKIYRLYSFKGVKSRVIPSLKYEYINGMIKSRKINRKFRGNYIKYVYNASNELEAPEIKRQVRKHWKILGFKYSRLLHC